MAEFISSLISERVIAGMQAARSGDKHLGWSRFPARPVEEIEMLAPSAELSIRKICETIDGRASRGHVGEIVKQARLQDQTSTRP
jgi:DNA invertase Pin-like site-specific DNA recombinase